jgi:hypothetical protein
MLADVAQILALHNKSMNRGHLPCSARNARRLISVRIERRKGSRITSASIVGDTTLAIGKYCNSPNPCPFTTDCWKGIPDISIFTIPQLDWKKKKALISQEILVIADLPASFSLTANQRAYVDGVLSDSPFMDADALPSAQQSCPLPVSLNSTIPFISSTSRRKILQFLALIV